MWQELAAAISALFLASAPFWNGFANDREIVLLNFVVAIHVFLLSIASRAISKYNLRTKQNRQQRRWLMYIAAAFGAAAAFVPPLLGKGADLTASRDNLVFGVAIFLFSLWSAMLPPYEVDEEPITRADAA
ncbi:MAG: hypothetical protein IMW98_06925 [Firmicutes bacterium]|nr:hypothetical protein [Bacillota bacterium]